MITLKRFDTGEVITLTADDTGAIHVPYGKFYVVDAPAILEAHETLVAHGDTELHGIKPVIVDPTHAKRQTVPFWANNWRKRK